MPNTARVPVMAMDNSTWLAAERNRLALERTLMAWVRTAISLITFGYGFYKAGQFVGANSPVHQTWFGPRQFGLTMIFIGILALSLGAHEHRMEQRQLQETFGTQVARSPARMLALAVATLGIGAFISLLFH